MSDDLHALTLHDLRLLGLLLAERSVTRVAEASGQAQPAVSRKLQRLRELLADTPAREKPRNGLLLRLFFGRQLGPDACRQLVLDAQGRAEAELAGLSAIRAEVEADDTADAPYILLTVMAGEHAARATLAWAHEALDVLEGQATPAQRSQ